MSNSEKQTTATYGNVESDCTVVSKMSVSNGQRDQTIKLFPSIDSTSRSKASKGSILRKKKLEAEKLAPESKIAESAKKNIGYYVSRRSNVPSC